MAIERNTSGFSNVASTDPLAAYPLLDPTAWKTWYENFVVMPDVVTHWVQTNTNGVMTVTQAGVIQTLAGGDNDLSQLHLASGTFALVSGKKTLFEAKIKVDKGAGGTIGQQELFIGLGTVQVGANFTAADGLTMAVDNCVGFWSPDATANLAAIVRKADAESIEPAASTYADATEYVLTWYFDGTSIIFYVDGTIVAHLYAFPTGVMAPHLFIKAGEAFASVLTVDYALVAQER